MRMIHTRQLLCFSFLVTISFFLYTVRIYEINYQPYLRNHRYLKDERDGSVKRKRKLEDFWMRSKISIEKERYNHHNDNIFLRSSRQSASKYSSAFDQDYTLIYNFSEPTSTPSRDRFPTRYNSNDPLTGSSLSPFADNIVAIDDDDSICDNDDRTMSKNNNKEEDNYDDKVSLIEQHKIHDDQIVAAEDDETDAFPSIDKDGQQEDNGNDNNIDMNDDIDNDDVIDNDKDDDEGNNNANSESKTAIRTLEYVLIAGVPSCFLLLLGLYLYQRSSKSRSIVIGSDKDGSVRLETIDSTIPLDNTGYSRMLNSSHTQLNDSEGSFQFWNDLMSSSNAFVQPSPGMRSLKQFIFGKSPEKLSFQPSTCHVDNLPQQQSNQQIRFGFWKKENKANLSSRVPLKGGGLGICTLSSLFTSSTIEEDHKTETHNNLGHEEHVKIELDLNKLEKQHCSELDIDLLDRESDCQLEKKCKELDLDRLEEQRCIELGIDILDRESDYQLEEKFKELDLNKLEEHRCIELGIDLLDRESDYQLEKEYNLQ